MVVQVVGSDLSDVAADQLKLSRKLYGQNGFAGASSDTPGQNTKSGFLPDPGTPINSQMRTIPDGNVPDAYGMKRQTKPVKSNAGA